MLVVISLPASDASPWMELFRAAMPGATVERRDPDRPADAAAPRADYVVAAWPSDTLFDEQRAPKAVFTVSAGVGHMLRLANFPRQVPLIRVEDAGMAAQMVRYVLASALRFAQRFDTYARQQRAEQWEQFPPRAPAAIVVGVLGLGVVGAAIARALADQGFTVRGHARTGRCVEGVRCYAGDREFHPFLDGLDLLVCVVPLTPATENILNRETMSRLADGAHVVNIGRGGALVEDDLLALLDSGKISGATLDVFRKEPLAPGHPFWNRPEIVVTPHVAGLTIADATVAQIASKIARLERGEPVTGVVDFTRGY